MKLVTAAEMRELEQGSVALGVSLDALMDNAGRALAAEIRGLFSGRPGSALVLVGPGNNGGDGLVCAESLRAGGWKVSLVLAPQKPRDTQRFPVLRAVPPLAEVPQAPADVIVDALLGTGSARPLEGPMAGLLDDVRRRQSGAKVVAVDLPSGVNADTGAADARTLPADLTVTFGLAKAGLFQFPAEGLSGEVRVADIGIPEELTEKVGCELSDEALVRQLLPPRPRDAHKGTFGKLLVIAGSASFAGAPYLTSMAAMRVGAGLVRIALPESAYPIVASKFTEATFSRLPETASGGIALSALPVLRELLSQEFDCLLIGPGLGQDPETIEVVRTLLLREQGLPPRVVVDADGLNSLAGLPEWWQDLPAGCVLTPHPAEFGRLASLSTSEVLANRLGLSREKAREWRQIVLAKGANCVLAAPDGRCVIDPGANPLVATAGTGDVLAGAIAGLATQGLEPWEAAVSGTRLCGLAAARLTPVYGTAGMLAGDLHEQLPLALRSLREG